MFCNSIAVVDPGEPRAPLIVRPNWGRQGRKNFGGRLGNPPPPPPPPSSILVLALTFLNFVNRKQVLLMK